MTEAGYTGEDRAAIDLVVGMLHPNPCRRFDHATIWGHAVFRGHGRTDSSCITKIGDDHKCNTGVQKRTPSTTTDWWHHPIIGGHTDVTVTTFKHIDIMMWARHTAWVFTLCEQYVDTPAATFFLACHVARTYLRKTPGLPEDSQWLVFVASLLLASQYIEMNPMETEHLMEGNAGRYTEEMVDQMATTIFQTIEANMHIPNSAFSLVSQELHHRKEVVSFQHPVIQALALLESTVVGWSYPFIENSTKSYQIRHPYTTNVSN
jgi:hypothetical protein